MPRIEENSSASVASGVVRRTTCAAAGEAGAARAARARGKRARKGGIAGKEAPPRRGGARRATRRGGGLPARPPPPPPPVPEEEDRDTGQEQQGAPRGVAGVRAGGADHDVHGGEEKEGQRPRISGKAEAGPRSGWRGRVAPPVDDQRRRGRAEEDPVGEGDPVEELPVGLG